jgi:glycogen(starch) synthase
VKVLFLSNLYPPNVVGGYERLCYDVATAFARKGHEISVLTSSYGGKTAEYGGQRIERSLKLLADDSDIYRPVSWSPQDLENRKAENISLFRKKVARERPDLLFIWNLYFLDRSLLEVIQETDCSRFFLITDNWLISFLKSSFWGEYFRRLRAEAGEPSSRWRSVLGRLLKKPTGGPTSINGKAVFASRFMERLYTEAGFRFQASRVIYHGVQLEKRTDAEYVSRNSLLERKALRLLFAGRIVEIKGVHTLIEALPSILERLPEHRLQVTILGETRDQDYLQRLKDLITRRGLADHILFRPPVEQAELFKLFQRYDLYVFPSIYEPFSLTLIHALYAGIPTIASDAGGNKEIIQHKENGLLFRAGNAAGLSEAVVNLATNGELRQEISLAARRVAGNYTFERMVSEVEDYLVRA